MVGRLWRLECSELVEVRFREPPVHRYYVAMRRLLRPFMFDLYPVVKVRNVICYHVISPVNIGSQPILTRVLFGRKLGNVDGSVGHSPIRGHEHVPAAAARDS